MSIFGPRVGRAQLRDEPGLIVELRAAAARLDRWIEAQQFVGWDPHDLLNSPILGWLDGPARWRHVAGIIAIQFGRRSPWNPRPLLRVPKVHNAKAAGLFVASYSRKAGQQLDSAAAEVVRKEVEWLATEGTEAYGGRGWGYPFPWPNRAFYAPRGEPTAVNTSFIVHGLLDAHELLRIPEALRLAEAGGEFLAGGLNRLDARDGLCFSYTPGDRRWVHNANALAASALARLGQACSREAWLELASRAARFTARRQRSDGSWPYGQDSGDGWVDNFHTAFVLDALSDVARVTADHSLLDSVERGYIFWKTNFCEPSGAQKYTPRRRYPLDVHSSAQSILTLLRHSDRDVEGFGLAVQVARWAVDHLQQPEGWFAYQVLPFGTLRIPYMRWSQAWMQRALVELAWRTSAGGETQA
jgi:hypothetical protein